MRRLQVYIELNGESVYAGSLAGDHAEDVRFSYAESYLSNPEHRSISLSLPLQGEPFPAGRTRCYFEGLLPEGFTRRCVAQRMQAEEGDYLSILAGLGRECLGAVKILGEDAKVITPSYRELTKAQVHKLAKEGATESAELVTKAHLSLTGASGKAGLYYEEKQGKWFLPVGAAPSTHIVKQSHVRLRQIVTNEQLCLRTAEYLGIETAQSFIVETDGWKSGTSENVLFAAKRFDRIMRPGRKTIDGLEVPLRLHQEDFAQALGIPASEKYEKKQGQYMQKAFELLRRCSADPVADLLKLWDICVFNYLIGNTDNHIKNLSLLYSPDLHTLRLAPAYDLLSTMIYESSTENMAMRIGGISNIYEISRDSFAEEAVRIGLGVKMAMNRFEKMVSGFEAALRRTADELTAQGFAQANDIAGKILQKGGIGACI